MSCRNARYACPKMPRSEFCQDMPNSSCLIASATYDCSYIVLVNTETQTGSIYRHIREQAGCKETRLIRLQHSVQFLETIRFSECATLSCTRDSWQILAHTIHKPHEACMLLLSCVRGSAGKTKCREDTLKMLKTIQFTHRVQHLSYFVFEVVVHKLLRLEDNLFNTTINGDLCDIHRCLFHGSSLRKPKKMAANINVCECNTLPVLPQYK